MRQRDVTVKPSLARTVLGGLAGGVVFVLSTFVTFVLIGSGVDQHSGPLVDPSIQSAKLIAVLTQMEPLPLWATKPHVMLLGYILFCIGHAFLFRSVSAAWPPGIMHRVWRLALVTWGLSYLFFELVGPFNLLGEPVGLVALELSFWGIAALIETTVVVFVLERRHERPRVSAT